MKEKTSFTFKTAALTFLAVIIALNSALCLPVYADDNSEVSPEINFLMQLKDYIRDSHVNEVKDLELLKGAINGMMESLNDPYSIYFSPKEFQDFNDATSGNFGGIGVVITIKDKLTTIISVLPGTPAERAGLKPNDKIVEIGSNSVKEVSISDVQKLLKGKEGTKVDIGVLRDGENQILKFGLVRDTIKINPIESKVLGQGIGYLKINEFNENTIVNLDVVLDYFKASGVVGVVLDLRNNPGGFLDQAIEAASYFVPKGPVVNLVAKDGAIKTFSSESNPYPFKLVVLVNGGSASASEILAGAIKDRGAGIIVGEQTFGKATVQKTLNLGSLGGIKITVARYTTPNGLDINKTGITPDVVVKAHHQDLTKDFSPIKGDRDLCYGNVGLDVLGLQQRLSLLNYFNVTPDGVYGPRTQTAVKKFQAQRGLKVTGIADTSFYLNLEAAIAEYMSHREDPQLRKAIDILKEELSGKSKAS